MQTKEIPYPRLTVSEQKGEKSYHPFIDKPNIELCRKETQRIRKSALFRNRKSSLSCAKQAEGQKKNVYHNSMYSFISCN